MSRPLHIIFDGDTWQAVDGDGCRMSLLPGKEDALPSLPDGYAAAGLMLPVERLLVRTFLLPLKHPRFLDANIIGHEINERSGENSSGWWLSWQAGTVDEGIAGLTFGLEAGLREAIDADEQWRDIGHVVVDAWERLSERFHRYVVQECAEIGPATGERVAVFDADAEGVFFGVWTGTGDGWLCCGLRRLNGTAGAGMSTGQIKPTLAAMGWKEEEGGIAAGRLGETLAGALVLQRWQGETIEEVDLPGRVDAAMMLAREPGLNLRHGIWKPRLAMARLRPWRRALAMAAAMLLIWIVGTGYQIYRLDSERAALQQRIVDAFHQGLPDETVIIDPLAQLRRATGGGGEGSESAGEWLKQLACINRVFLKRPWKMHKLSLDSSGQHMAGSVKDLEALNGIREHLQQETGREVRLLETNLGDGTVMFRVAW